MSSSFLTVSKESSKNKVMIIDDDGDIFYRNGRTSQCPGNIAIGTQFGIAAANDY